MRVLSIRFVAVVCLLAGVSAAWAQTSTGSLSGAVQDSSGGAIPGARVRLIDPATSAKMDTTTNQTGLYTFALLTSASYRLEVEANGFRRFVRSPIEVHVNQQVTVDVLMEVGTVAESVEVKAESPQLEQSSAALGGTISTRLIEDLPMNNRQVYSLAVLTPGVTSPNATGNAPDSTRFNYAVGFSVDGSFRESAKVVVDGQDVTLNVNNPSFNGVSSVPSADAVQEFKVQSNAFSAEFGRAAGGVVNVTLRSGTNQVHGSFFEYLRNSVLDANDFFSNRSGVALGSFKRNQFGGSFGGPAYIPKVYNGKDKTFFFVAVEGLRERSASPSVQRVPTALERDGNFSQTFTAAGVPIKIYDPFTSTRNADGTFSRQQFAGNIVPKSRFNKVSSNLLKYFPDPNNPGQGPSHVGNFVYNGAAALDQDREDVKIDHNFSSNSRFSVKYSRLVFASNNANTLGNIAGAYGTEYQRTHNGALSFTKVLSSSSVLDLGFGFSRLENPRTVATEGFDVTTIGLPANIRDTANVRNFPRFDVNGYASLGQTPDIPLANMADMYSSRGSLSKLRGSHSLKFGGEWQIRQVNHSQNGGSGTFTSNASMTQGPDPQKPAAGSGDGLASFLLGTPSSGSMDLVPFISTQNHSFGAYVQDDWRISRKLTLNFGLRYDLELPRHERYNRQNWWDGSVVSPLAPITKLPLRGGLQFAGVNGNPTSPNDTDRNNISPRFGFAWQSAKTMVVRGGYGIFYGISPVGAGGVGAGNVTGYRSTTSMIASVDGVTPYRTFDNPYADGFVLPRGAADGLLTAIGTNAASVSRDAVTPYGQQWNVSIQKQLPASFLIEGAYAGSHGSHLQLGSFGLNPLPLEAMSLGTKLNDLVDNPFFGQIQTGNLSPARVQRRLLLTPYPQFTNVTSTKPTIGNSIYHSLQLRAEKRFSKGLTLLAAYTNSKLITDSDAAETFLGPNAAYQTYTNFQLERSLGSMDVSQRLVLSYSYELPFGKHWSRPMRSLLAGWKVNGITTLQTGFPIFVRTRTDSSQASGQGTQRPNSTGASANLPMSRSRDEKIAEWFDIAAFTQPATFTFGNIGRTLPNVRTDSPRNFDLSMFKNFELREGMKLQFRSEFFNAFNRPLFGTPNNQLGAPAFGTISSQANSPRQIQFALRLNY